MSDLYSFAEQFLKLVESEGSDEDSDSLNVKLAGRQNRKQLQKNLELAKKKYLKFKSSVESNHKISDDLASVIDHDSKEMESARKDVMRAYDVLKNMDLVDSNEVKFMANDDVGYVKNKRIYKLEVDDTGNVSLAPFKRKKKVEEEVYEDDDDDTADADADELYATLVD